MDLYREEILEHWRNPQNFGVMDKPDVVVEQVNPLCGDEITMYFKFSSPLSSPPFIRHSRESGNLFRVNSRGSRNWIPNQVGNDNKVIQDVSFVGSGCAISVASASMLSEAIKGMSVDTISKITGVDVLKLIGGNVAPARLKCAFLALEAVRKLKPF